MSDDFPNLWKLGELVVDDPICPAKLYLIKDDVCAAKQTLCECGATRYKITRQLLYELEGIRFVKIAERELKKEVKK
ncbi:unnamed protein product [marine sediment metagenome]|uniref:Uncharacterized protein n=1 Tax=marine sediment metagenome TaxID=412755 RepID=X1P4D3_9ZZZZ